MKTRNPGLVFLSFCGLLLCRCDGGEDGKHTADAGTDASTPEECAPSYDEKFDVEEAKYASAAGIEDEADLLCGFEARGKKGDFLIENSRVRFVIQGRDEPRLWGPFGGSIIDADVARAQGCGKDNLMEMFPIVGFIRGVHPEEVGVLQNGSDGKAAVVRLFGKDAPIPLLQAAAGAIMKPVVADVTVDYVLRPDAEHLEIVTTIRNRSGAMKRVKAGDAVIFGGRLKQFAPKYGRDLSQMQGKSDISVVVGFLPGEVSYALFNAGGPFEVPLTEERVWPMASGNPKLDPDQCASVPRYLFVGGGDVGEILGKVAAFRRDAYDAKVSGRAERQGGGPLAGAEITVFSGEDAVSATTAGEDGSFSVPVKKGKYRVECAAPFEQPVSADADATGGEAIGVSCDFPAATLYKVDVTGERFDGTDEGPIPAKISFYPEGTAQFSGDGLHFLQSLPAEPAQPMWPGKYTVVVSHGPFYGIAVLDVELTAGQTATISAVLAEEVDTGGFFSASMHGHTSLGVDSEESIYDRIAQAAGDDLDVLVSAEHDIVVDYTPYIGEMDLDERLLTFQGLEISPQKGHTNGLFVTLPAPDRRGFWTLKWWKEDANGEFEREMTAAEVYRAAREKLGGILQMNHPRDGTAYLDVYGYDPKEPFSNIDPSLIDSNFDLLEVFNGHDTPGGNAALLDFYSFQNQGLAIHVSGNADSHSLGAEIGYPRNMILVGEKALSEVTRENLTDAFLAGRTFVCAGPMVQLEAEDAGGNLKALGEVVTQAAGSAKVKVKIQAPSWMDVKRLRLIVNGSEAENIEIPDSDEAVRFDGEVPLEGIEKDAWVAAIVEGDEALTPVFGGAQPFAATNPIYLDLDGDGSYTAPGLE